MLRKPRKRLDPWKVGDLVVNREMFRGLRFGRITDINPKGFSGTVYTVKFIENIPFLGVVTTYGQLYSNQLSKATGFLFTILSEEGKKKRKRERLPAQSSLF